jgi:hypothetical protein
VRPNALPEGVPVDKTLEQIGRALNEVAEYGAGFGVTIRLEVHGRGTQELPNIKKIMDVAEPRAWASAGTAIPLTSRAMAWWPTSTW